MNKTLPKQKANQMLSYILWNRKFKPVKKVCVLNGGVMSDEDFEKAMTEVNAITNKN